MRSRPLSLLVHIFVQGSFIFGFAALMSVYAHAQENQATTNATSTIASTSPTAATQTAALQASSSNSTGAVAVHGFPVQKQKRLTDLAANISNRFDAAIARLNDISRRMSSRADKMSAQNLDMTDARFYIGEAGKNIASVQNDLNNMDARVAQTVSSQTPGSDWAGIRNTFLDAKIRLVKAKQLLQNSMDDMKNKQLSQTLANPAPQQPSNPATSTSATTATTTH